MERDNSLPCPKYTLVIIQCDKEDTLISISTTSNTEDDKCHN